MPWSGCHDVSVSRDRLAAVFARRRARLRSRRYATAALNPPTAPGATVPVTTPDGARLRVRVYGPAEGRPIVLVHGWGCCLEYWNPQVNAFAEEYRLICYDQRGHGESGLGADGPSIDQLGDDLATVLAATLRPGEPAVLVGHSMGGITVQAWAARHRDQFDSHAAGAILANTTSGRIATGTELLPGFNVPLRILGRRVQLSARLLVSLLGLPLPIPGGPLVKWLIRWRIMSRNATSDEVAFVLNIVRSCPPRGRARVERMLAEFDLGPAAEHLTVPTTVIAGDRDRLLPLAMSRALADALSRVGSLVDFYILPTGHAVNIEATNRFNAELAATTRRAFDTPSATTG
ncbi:alpha/beta hydrolase [Nocardia otitidiscaviarum]|nr:alpha/beta hydrolase [Nocardia otitidiscaviarum]